MLLGVPSIGSGSTAMSEFTKARIAIVAALEREVRPLVKGWRVAEKEYSGRRFRFFESGDVVLVCGGIGAEAARRAAEAAIVLFSPDVIYSVGFAGGLNSERRIGDVLEPRRVVDASDGSSTNMDHGTGVLVSFGSVATPAQKSKLKESFGAEAVDMEAAAVARAAEARGVRFAVLKAISDEMDSALPEMDRFVDFGGRFSELRFVFYAVLRPWLWPRVVKLARDSNRASQALCRALQNLIDNGISVADESGHALQAVPRQ
jgi:adenosylhomocysteine nucleosidase